MKKVILIILMIFSIVSLWAILINTINNDRIAYEENIKLADKYFDAELYYDAMDKYREAIKYSDCKNLEYKIALCEKNLNLSCEFILSMQAILEKYPESLELLDEILAYYLKQDKYDDMKAVILRYKDVNIYDDILNNYENILKTKYTLKFVSYEKVLSLGDEYIEFEDADGAGVSNTSKLNKYLKKYDKAGAFSNTEPSVSSVVKDNKRFYVDMNGYKRIYLQFEYDYLGDFGDNGLAKFRRKGKCGYINLHGDEIKNDFCDCVGFYDSEVSFIKDKNGWKIINDDLILVGKQIFESIYLENNRAFNFEKAFVKKSDKYALVDSDGILLTDYIFDEVSLFRERDGLAAVKIGDKYAFIDKYGDIYKYIECDGLGSYSCGIAPIKIADKWGYLNAEGDMIVEATFDMALCVNKYGITAVKLDESFYILNFVYY